MPYIIAFVFGTVVGSFLNVCIYRLPRGYSIVRPSSRCPACQSPIKAYDNIPLISFILLRGRCRHCGARISLRYPLVEFLNGLLYAVVLWRYGPSAAGFFFMLYMSALIVITFVDIDFQIIPDIITIPGSIIGLIAGLSFLPDSFNRISALGATQSILGLLLGFGLYLFIAVLSKGGMGGGDIKMMAMVGAVTGWKGVLLTTFLGSLVGSIVGIGLMIIKKKGRKTKIPFGPFLALGCMVSILFGEEVLKFYLNIGH
jgi:leader peptidase (prepilin peptidase)/N-methyltransferase